MPPRCTVLLIEDDSDIRDAIHMLLDLEQYSVVEAPDGAAGLREVARSPTPLVVLVDYLMPLMNGLQLLRSVASEQRLVHRHRYVLMTANYDRLPPDASDLLASLAVDTVNKPFDIAELLRVVERACQRLRLRVSAVTTSTPTTRSPPT